ncbi:hypothetical protein [Marinospirillum alkaliphilum]|uniref:Uncharacterized protein n=1 Tax=Marinospirillum alkaliphilum DSM 21637 TaxID=1122209 RepID=A0A1K1ZUN4_9GAMM|nr:hypothetical protein [Marinospirillum alkaliphilum]SFX77467.1 hypothetical protein SAMN02745752_02840 [Marinospirillum alkaliphilum DSM 21637]
MIKRIVVIVISSIMIAAAFYALAIFFICDQMHNKKIFCYGVAEFGEFYSKNIRGHLFAGFLALGGFLLSLKTFIIVNMKENVYDNEQYRENWRGQKKHDDTLELYGPLKELSDLLYYAIIASFFTAILQMTLGLYGHWFTAIICSWSALLSVMLIIDSLRIIKRNLDSWFDSIK